MEPLISREQTIRALCAQIEREPSVSSENVEKLLALAQVIFQSPFWAPSDLDQQIAKALTKCYNCDNNSLSAKVRDFTKKHFSKVRDAAANDLIFEIQGQQIEVNSLLSGSASEYSDRLQHASISQMHAAQTLYGDEDPFLFGELNKLISGTPVKVKVEELKPLLDMGDRWLVTDIRQKVEAVACSLVDARSLDALTTFAKENQLVELGKACSRFALRQKYKQAGEAFRTLRHKWHPEKQKLEGFHISLTKEEKAAINYLKEFSKEIGSFKEIDLTVMGTISQRECLWLLSAISADAEVIHVRGADFKDTKALARFRKVRDIDLSHSPHLRAIDELEQMPLKRVNLNNCPSLGRFEPLYKHRLEYLNLAGCQEAYFSDLPYWLKDVAIVE